MTQTKMNPRLRRELKYIQEHMLAVERMVDQEAIDMDDYASFRKELNLLLNNPKQYKVPTDDRAI